MEEMNQNQFQNLSNQNSPSQPEFQPQQPLEIKSEVELKKDRKYLKISLMITIPVLVMGLIIGTLWVIKNRASQKPTELTVTTTPVQPETSFEVPQPSETEILLNDLNTMIQELEKIQPPLLDSEFQQIDQEINQL